MTWGLQAISAADLAEFFGRAFLFLVGGWWGGWQLRAMEKIPEAF